MRFAVADHRFLSFFPPYRAFTPVDDPGGFPDSAFPLRGGVIVWNLATGDWGRGFRALRSRPPGVALFLLLPPPDALGDTERLLELMEHCRPHSVLPHQEELESEEMVSVLKRMPSEFSLEVMDYLRWRGIEVDMDTRRILRKTLELSGELRTVQGLARSLYMSRRALGRRFMTRGLPVPSHWLHFGRVLRASIMLQNSGATLVSVGCEMGYSDGFSLSNQMKRLTGLRPSLMRTCFGWEWIVESWLHLEAKEGNLSPALRRHLFPGITDEARRAGARRAEATSEGRRMLRVAEEAGTATSEVRFREES
jgi:AraC-like DNA-binding protein